MSYLDSELYRESCAVIEKYRERIADLEAQLATARALMAEECARAMEAEGHRGMHSETMANQRADKLRALTPLQSGLVAVPVETLTKAVVAASCELKRTGHNSHSQPRAGLEALVPGGVTVPPGSKAGFLSIPVETLKQAKEALEELVEIIDGVRAGKTIVDNFTSQPARAALTALKAVLP